MTENFMVRNITVEKFTVEKFMVEKFMVEKFMVEKSGVEMSHRQPFDWLLNFIQWWIKWRSDIPSQILICFMFPLIEQFFSLSG